MRSSVHSNVRIKEKKEDGCGECVRFDKHYKEYGEGKCTLDDSIIYTNYTCDRLDKRQ